MRSGSVSRGLVAVVLLGALAACDAASTAETGPSRGTDPAEDTGRRPPRPDASDRPVEPGTDVGPDTDTDGDVATDVMADAPEAADTTGPDAPGPDEDTGFGPPDVAVDETLPGAGFWEPEVPTPVDVSQCPPDSIVPTLCIAEVVEADASLCDGFDNDCDGQIDEGCVCKQGEVQPCFAGPPGRVGVGACASGTQRCETGTDTQPHWGACTGGISPSREVCDGLDNDCNGCTDEIGFCSDAGSCPGPGDVRTPDAQPFSAYPLRGGDFYTGPATSWSWRIEGGSCDGIVPGRQSFVLDGANQQDATFRPSLSGSYTVTLTVQTPDGPFVCTWVIHVVGPGVRIEMCYPESTTQDLDLFLMRTSTPGPWYGPSGDVYNPNGEACSWNNCEARMRGSNPRTNWGYPNTPIENCSGGPQGDQWRALGFCANPRLDIDNNLSEGTGLPENINVDNPRVGDAYRIMVHNFSGTAARPLVNVYCGGRLKATFGAAPDELVGFSGPRAQVGAMWRVAEVLVLLAPDGTTDCEVTSVHPPGATTGYDLTFGDSRF